MCKKSLLMMLLLALLVPWAAKAQETLTVHDGTATNNYVPFYGYYADSYNKCEMVYPATELSDMAEGTITSMTFYATESSVSWGCNFQVFLAEVDETTISAFVGPGTVVYEGVLSISGNQMAVTFSTPYVYNGGNLLVGVYNTSTGSYLTSTWNGETVEGASVQGYSYDGLNGITGSQRNFLPKTTFGYLPAGAVYVASPSNLNVTLTPGDGTVATLAWTENGTATQWQICLNGDETNLITASTNPYQLIGLTPETAYTAKVRATTADGESAWSNEVTFTPTDAIQLTVNDGTTTNGYVPIYGTWVDNITKSQFIIPAENLADMAWGTISKMTFYASNSSVNWGNAQFEVYMTETNETTLSALADYGTMTKVKNAGSLSISGNQMVVQFDTPFSYMGGNLMIGFLQTVSGSYSGCSWYGVSATGASMGGYGSSISQRNFLPKTTFDYEPGEEPACMWPTNLAVSNVTAHTAELSWTSDGTAWQIGYSTDGFVTEQYVDVTETSYTLTGLAPETAYQVRVQTNCGGGTYSVFTNPVSFTTTVACPVPTVAVINITATTADVTCTNTDASAFNVQLINPNATPADTTLIENVAMPYTLTGLTQNTSYRVRVKALCGGEDGESAWSIGTNFMTAEECPDGMVCIGTGTATSSNVPVTTCYNYSLSQQIYTADEIGEAGAVLSIDFYSTNGAAKPRNFDIYMVNTDKSRFESTTDWIAVTAADLVYSATNYTWQTGWNSFELDVPFVYDGTSNVAIVVDDEKVTSYECSVNFGVFDAPSQAIYVRRDDSNYDPFNTTYTATGVLNLKNRIRLAIGEPPACPKPTGLTVNYEGGTEATISWNSDAEAWNMRVNGVDVNGVITNPYTLTGLELATTYEVEVQANCGSDLSEWVGPVSFTTDDCMPEDMTIINYELADSYGDGWNGNYILVVDGDCNVVEALTITSGNSASGTLKVCGQYISFMWYNGNYANETSWTFNDAEGTVLFSGTGTASMQNYDVLYVYDNESVKRPSDLVVPEDAIGAYGAKLSWTENGTATAWQIAVYDETETLINTVDANSNPFMLTGLQAETNYIVKVRSVTSAGQSAWTCPGVGFTTGVACGAPSALDITPYPISANVDWTVFEEGYDIEWTEVSTAKDGGLWLQYDNGTFATSIGSTTSGVRTWGVMYPAAMLEGNKNLTKVAVYENATYYTCESYTINIYQGINQPETLVGTETVVPSGETGMHEITLTAPITLDLTQNLWITMTVEGTYVMSACQSTERNNQWWDNNADGVWTNMGDDNSNLAGYGWMIRGYVEGYDPADFNWTSETNVLPPYTIENLSPETTYFVKVKASCGTDWKWAQFTTPSACDAPVNLTAVAEATSATLNWVGYQDSYNVQYRTAVKYIPVWEDDFENGLDNWTIYTEGESPQTEGWYVYDATNISTTNHSGSYVASAWSWSSDAYDADNWLITPQLDLQGVLKYYVRTSSSYPDSYEVLLSTTDAETTSFTVTLQAMAPAPTNGEWNEVVIDLSAYAGQQGYIAIHHVDYDMNYLFIDDLGIYTPEAAGAWIPVTVNEPTCTLNGLIPETEYEWQVQGINESCDGGLTEWSEIQNFTTLEQTTVTQTIALSSGTTWVSFYVDVTLDDLKSALVAALPSGNATAITIKSQTQNVKYSRGRWMGQLTSLDMTQMYTITVSSDCEISFEAMPVDPSEQTVTINSGVNWIAFPFSSSMSVTDFFGSFPVNNDVVKSQGQNSRYQRGRWMGQLGTLEPGQGYNYNSADANPRTFTFPTSAKSNPRSVQNPVKVTDNSMVKQARTTDIDLPRK